MLALFFEVKPRQGHLDHYFRHVAMLKPELEKHTGLIWIDRFNSLSREDVLLSHQLWEDEAAIIRWREDQHHRGSQTAGREKHFADYRIRIIEVAERVAGGNQVQSFALSGAATGGWVVAAHGKGGAVGGRGEQFRSVNFEDRYVTLAAAESDADAAAMLKSMSDDACLAWGITGRIIRDYGMFERAQAPHP
jgi:heme-degrading monooxygenase HmoA